MNDSSSSSFASASYSSGPRRQIHANTGITLSVSNDRYLVRPCGTAPPLMGEEACALPQISAGQVEFAAGWLRHVWRQYGRCCAWLLYLNLNDWRWHLHFPPQQALPDGFRLDLTFGSFPAPPDSQRLAGTFRTCPYEQEHDLRDDLAHVDGMHLVMRPQIEWATLLSFVHADGQLHSVPVRNVVADDLRRYSRTDLPSRLRLIND